jgi:hypothetical protein
MASGNEVEKLTVTLEADYSKLVRQTKEGVDQAEKELDKLGDAPKKAQGGFEQLGGFLKGQFLSIITGIGAAIAAAFSVGVVVNFFKTVASGMIETNKQFETFEVQFETLLGSRSEAKKRIDELAQFGIATPFELDQIVEADRLLQTFGGTALATGENLRRIGDSAAAVNADFKEVSFWTGRLYSSMMAGRPFGEASARLQELGILSGETRTKLEDMQKAGAKGTEIWAAYSEMVDTKFSGAMDKLSKTLQGVMSNLADFQSMLLREGGEELFEGVREDVIEFYDIISSPEAQEALIKLSEALGSVIDSIRESVTGPVLEQLQQIEPETVESLSESLQDLGEALGGLLDINTGSLNDIIVAIDGAIQGIASFIQTFNRVKESTGLAALNDAWVSLNQTILSTPLYIIEGFSDGLKSLTGSSLSEWIGGVEQPAMAAASSLDAMGFAADGVAENMRGAAQATEEAAEDFSKAREKMDGLISSFQDAKDDTGEKRAEAAQEHGERLAEINSDNVKRLGEIWGDYQGKIVKLDMETAEQRLEIEEKTGEALAELAADTAKQQTELEEKARLDLAELEANTQTQIDEVREDARKKEKEETETHQREMNQLQQNYTMDLEDAVKSRDARAIVDLRRRFQAEKKEREESFEEKKGKSGDEAEDRVAEIRTTERKRRQEIERSLRVQLRDLEANEAEKRAEINASQKKQIAELEENEAEKRAQLRQSYDEQMADANAKYAEQINNENERYAERQAALDEALAKRLEQVAKELADEKEINEEGAQAILETLNDYFGIGGEIDELMEDFKNRRQEKVTISMEFEDSLGGEGDRPGGRGRGGTGGGSLGGRGLRQFAEGGVVPGLKGEAQMAVVHGGELIVPYDQVKSHMGAMRDSMALNFQGQQELAVTVNVKGDKMGGTEANALAGVLVRAFNEAGIKTRQR